MADPAPADVRAATRGAVLAELLYVRGDGTFDATVVTPLTDDGGIVVALPYARRRLAEDLEAARQVALAVSDARLSLSGWSPIAAIGRVALEEDPDGIRFRAGLVDQEVRKHPPSRLLADSLMARREHWWFMPRLLCRLIDVEEVHALAPRDAPDSGVLGWVDAGRLRLDTVDVRPDGERALRVVSRAGRSLDGDDAPACLVRHDFSIPDLEQRTTLVERGRLSRGVLRVESVSGDLALPRPPRLLTRIRRHRALARACRRELARGRSDAAGQQEPPGHL